jgi:hypothetical protein
LAPGFEVAKEVDDGLPTSLVLEPWSRDEFPAVVAGARLSWRVPEDPAVRPVVELLPVRASATS